MTELEAIYELTLALREHLENTARGMRTLAAEVERLTDEQETMVGDIAVLKHELGLETLA